MKFLSIAAVASLLSFTSAVPVPAAKNSSVPTGLSFELAGLRGHEPDIRKSTPLVLSGDDLAYPDSSPSSKVLAVSQLQHHDQEGITTNIHLTKTIQPWSAGELIGVDNGKLNGLQGYLIKNSEDEIYDFKFGKVPSGNKDALTNGFFAAEDHPDGGPVGTQQLFVTASSDESAVGAFLIKSSGSAPHAIKWFNGDASKIPDGGVQGRVAIILSYPLYELVVVGAENGEVALLAGDAYGVCDCCSVVVIITVTFTPQSLIRQALYFRAPYASAWVQQCGADLMPIRDFDPTPYFRTFWTARLIVNGINILTLKG
ncbi:hypothetical protein KEM56_004310 [Ascosphaera pollenicola]|nr:hypothetical protein KEM56_004310 [Ascosphaera pollenicola]